MRNVVTFYKIKIFLYFRIGALMPNFSSNYEDLSSPTENSGMQNANARSGQSTTESYNSALSAYNTENFEEKQVLFYKFM
jgi:hypothetical protein